MPNKFSLSIFLLALCILLSACGDHNAICCKSHTKVSLKDSCTLNIGIDFCFNNEKEMRNFKYREKEVLFAIRLALKQHKSSMLMKQGRNNVRNAIIAICKRRLNNKFHKIKITDYHFTSTGAAKHTKHT